MCERVLIPSLSFPLLTWTRLLCLTSGDLNDYSEPVGVAGIESALLASLWGFFHNFSASWVEIWMIIESQLGLWTLKERCSQVFGGVPSFTSQILVEFWATRFVDQMQGSSRSHREQRAQFLSTCDCQSILFGLRNGGPQWSYVPLAWVLVPPPSLTMVIVYVFILTIMTCDELWCCILATAFEHTRFQNILKWMWLKVHRTGWYLGLPKCSMHALSGPFSDGQNFSASRVLLGAYCITLI